MSSERTNRAAFLKAAGLSALAIPALGGMAGPIRTFSSVGRDARLSLPDQIAKIPDLSSLSMLIQNTPAFLSIISGTGPFTMFTPSNEAFSRLRQSQLNRLQDPDIALNVLQFHTLSGLYKKSDLAQGQYTNLLGSTVKISQVGPAFFINHVLIQRQFPATNGEGQVIDKVLNAAFRTGGS
jgi:uncharacterized surface protein with fasciclin (FAS1) repeats